MYIKNPSADTCKRCYDRSFASVTISIKNIDNVDGKDGSIKPLDYWRYDLNLNKNPLLISKSVNKKFWFEYIENHPFELRLTDCSSRGNWCPYLGRKRLCGKGSRSRGSLSVRDTAIDYCDMCYYKSFASVKKIWGRPADYMVDDVDPLTIFKSSHTKYTFYCTECNHNFETNLYRMSKNDVAWPCSYCNGDLLCENGGLPKDDSEWCEFCYNNSFASHYRSGWWCEDNIVTPYDVRKYTAKKYWFWCECGHTFESSLTNILTNDSWCPYCSTSGGKLCDDLECEQCFDKSFAVSDRAQHLDPDYEVDSRTIFINSHTKLHFICDVDSSHKFTTSPNKITSLSQWCGMCKKKTETKLLNHLQLIYPDLKIYTQYKFIGNTALGDLECRNPETNRPLFFDFYIPDLNLIIEVDGPQHFTQIHNWELPEVVQIRDRYKEEYIKSRGIHLIRVLQTDVYYDQAYTDVDEGGDTIIRTWVDYLSDAIECVTDATECRSINLY